jgi:gas vesicle protein
MSITATPQQSHFRDIALAAITEAHELVGRGGEQRAQFEDRAFKSEKEKNAMPHPPSDLPRSAESGPGSSRGGLALRSMGLVTVACIGVAAFAWRSNHDQPAPDPISTSSVSNEKREMPARPVPYKADMTAETGAGTPHPPAAQTALQRLAPEAPVPAAIAPDVSQQIQTMVRELANVEQGIDQLKTGQIQMVRGNAELAEHLRAAQETARHNADLAEDLKAAQAQMARDNVNLAEQLKASQDQMAKIAGQLKESQEQVARLLAPEQKPRPKTLVSSPLPIANATRKPVPTPQSLQVRAQTQDQRHLQPKQTSGQ